MTYDPRIHNRQSIRLKGYDYSRSGLYFVTICCQDKAHLFGHVENGKMVLNDPGRMVVKWYDELTSKYPDKKCHVMVVMPNHVHFILENARGDAYAGAPDDDAEMYYGPENHQFNSPLGNAVGWFKTMTTNEYIRGVKSSGWKRFNRRVWQRNYYERIIWTDRAYQRISQYIIDNPKKWDSDRFHKQ